jgi:mitogen-activated protein kinase 15
MLYAEISMDDNKKFSIREYREALYSDIVKRKKEQRKKWQAKYLQKLGVTDTTELEHTP